MVSHDDVCVLVPTYNEASTIEAVVRGFRDQGFDDVLVMDGGSEDDTRERARAAGARVETQRGEGKGQAVRESLEYIHRPVVLMIDGDMTYRPDQADRLLEPIAEGRAEHVIGNRFGDLKPGAMTRLNRVGNYLMNRSFAWIHGSAFDDILTGYRAFTRESLERFSLTADGFGIETEMSGQCVEHDIDVAVVPITYQPRPDDSETNLHPIFDGGRIFWWIYRLSRRTNPRFYFGFLALVALVAVGLLGALGLLLGGRRSR